MNRQMKRFGAVTAVLLVVGLMAVTALVASAHGGVLDSGPDLRRLAMQMVVRLVLSLLVSSGVMEILGDLAQQGRIGRGRFQV